MKEPHPATTALLDQFAYGHLRPRTRRSYVSAACAMLAHRMAEELEDTDYGAELTAGLRKLLEAKDCFVRAAIPKADRGLAFYD